MTLNMCPKKRDSWQVCYIYTYKTIIKGLILLTTVKWDTNAIGYCQLRDQSYWLLLTGLLLI